MSDVSRFLFFLIPEEAEFAAVFGAVAQVEINEILVGNAGLGRHGLEVVDHLVFEANGHGLFFLFHVGIPDGFGEIVFGFHSFRSQ
jgi:hypothetical protein